MITSFFCTLASISGLSSNDGGMFLFRHIPNSLITNWDLKNLSCYFFIVRAAWDDNPDWILNAEKSLVQNLCYAYEGKFESTLKNMGFVARIISMIQTRRLRELNNLMAKKTGYRLTVVNLSDKKGRREKCV